MALRKLYKGYFYTKMGQAQISFLQSMVSSLLLIGLYFALGITELLIIGIVLFPIFLALGLWFVRTPYGGFYQDTKERNKFSALNQMILHLWSTCIDFVLNPTPENRENLITTNQKCKSEWLLNAY